MEVYSDFPPSVEKSLSEIDEDWRDYAGVVICGTHDPKEVEFLLQEIRSAREDGIPFLGICYGHQLAAIEYARNVLGIRNATSQEFGHGTYVVKKRSELKVGLHDGESYWNNYEVDLPAWNKPDHFITVQYHPEYQSSKGKPHPVLVRFLNICRKQASL